MAGSAATLGVSINSQSPALSLVCGQLPRKGAQGGACIGHLWKEESEEGCVCQPPTTGRSPRRGAVALIKMAPLRLLRSGLIGKSRLVGESMPLGVGFEGFRCLSQAR